MKKFVKKERIKLTIYSIFLVVFGMLFILIPNKSINILEIITATCLIIYGIVGLLGYCVSPIFIRDPLQLLEALIAIVFGALLDFFPSLFILGIGLFIMFGGLKHFILSLEIREKGDKNWWIDSIFGLIISGLGLAVAILCNTSVAERITSIMLGVSMIISGLMYFIMIFALKRYLGKIKKSKVEGEDPTIEYEIK